MRREIVGALVACCLLTQAALGDDSQVAQRLSETLRNAQKQEELKGFRINVKVENGVVWMKGSVKSKVQREKALDLARRVEGVRLVVNDLQIDSGAQTAASVPQTPPQMAQPAMPVQPTRGVGSGVMPHNPAVAQVAIQQAQAMAAANLMNQTQLAAASAGGATPQMVNMGGQSGQMPVMFVPVPYPTPVAAQAPVNRNPVPVRGGQVTRMVNYAEPAGCPSGGCGPVYGGYGGGPMPEHSGYPQGGVVYDEPQMPNHAWPGYAAHPNYAALQYPTQYSAQAWPYIGPFYPYPQVPLGWRKVALEWDDGWWWLDFKSK